MYVESLREVDNAYGKNEFYNIFMQNFGTAYFSCFLVFFLYYSVLGAEFWTICLLGFEFSQRRIYIAPFSSPLEWAGYVLYGTAIAHTRHGNAASPFLDCLNGFCLLHSETRMPDLCCILKYGSYFQTQDGYDVLGPHFGSSQHVQTTQPALGLFHNVLNIMTPAKIICCSTPSNLTVSALSMLFLWQQY